MDVCEWVAVGVHMCCLSCGEVFAACCLTIQLHIFCSVGSICTEKDEPYMRARSLVQEGKWALGDKFLIENVTMREVLFFS